MGALPHFESAGDTAFFTFRPEPVIRLSRGYRASDTEFPHSGAIITSSENNSMCLSNTCEIIPLSDTNLPFKSHT